MTACVEEVVASCKKKAYECCREWARKSSLNYFAESKENMHLVANKSWAGR